MGETVSIDVVKEANSTGDAVVDAVKDETTKSYELRNVCARDIYPISKIISKIGLREFKECFESEEMQNLVATLTSEKEGENNTLSDEDIISIGIKIAFEVGDVILGNLSSCEEHINHLLSNLSGKTKKEISELPLATFAEMVIDVVKMDDFRDFVKAVSKLRN